MTPQGEFPGVYVEERPGDPPIEPAATTVTFFVGAAPPAPAGVTNLHSFADYLRSGGVADTWIAEAIRAFFQNGGTAAVLLGLVTEPHLPSDLALRNALVTRLLDSGAADDIRFNLLCVPGFDEAQTVKALQSFCARKRAFFIMDAPREANVNDMPRHIGRVRGPDARNAALYFPWIKTETGVAPPCGFVAGVYARTDVARGVWKAPAGADSPLRGASEPLITIDQHENESLNPEAVNCLRDFPDKGLLVWGARTLAGNDGGEADWKYVPVRRLALFVEESIADGLQWVVFEPNGEPLWSRISLSVASFLHGLFRQGAFEGATPREAYFVRCDATTMTQQDINSGRINVVVGFAPTRPAEFIVITLTLLLST